MWFDLFVRDFIRLVKWNKTVNFNVKVAHLQHPILLHDKLVNFTLNWLILVINKIYLHFWIFIMNIHIFLIFNFILIVDNNSKLSIKLLRRLNIILCTRYYYNDERTNPRKYLGSSWYDLKSRSVINRTSDVYERCKTWLNVVLVTFSICRYLFYYFINHTRYYYNG